MPSAKPYVNHLHLTLDRYR